MAFDIGQTGVLPDMVREGREGVQCERAFRCLTFLLYGWCYHPDSSARELRKDRAAIHTRSMEAIPFDKMAVFAARIWQELYNRARRTAPRPGPVSVPSPGGQPSFPYPFREIPGKHGRGLGRYHPRRNGDAPVYLLEILYNLHQAGLSHYIEVVPPAPDRPGAAPNPRHYRTTVLPAVEVTSPQSFLQGFSYREIEILIQLQTALKRLTASEIRALGTHQNLTKTREDVAQEYRYFSESIEDVAGAIRDGSSFVDSAREAEEVMDEALRKARGNQDSYSSAYATVAAELQDQEIRAAFVECQTAASGIWGDSELVSLARLASEFRGVARFLQAFGHFQDQVQQSPGLRPGSSGRYMQLWSEGLREMGGDTARGLPLDPADAFAGNGGAHTPVLRRVNALVDDARRRTRSIVDAQLEFDI